MCTTGVRGKHFGMKTTTVLIAALLTCIAAPGAAQEGDALDESLALVGLRRADLGWRPKGWWAKFPAQIPYKLRSFDALFAQAAKRCLISDVPVALLLSDGIDSNSIHAVLSEHGQEIRAFTY